MHKISLNFFIKEEVAIQGNQISTGRNSLGPYSVLAMQRLNEKKLIPQKEKAFYSSLSLKKL